MAIYFVCEIWHSASSHTQNMLWKFLIRSCGQRTVGTGTASQRCVVEQEQPIPSMLTKPQVHALAERIGIDLGYVPGSPIESFVNKIGGKIGYRPLLPPLDGTGFDSADSIHVGPDGRFIIFVSGLASVERDRFTIAHELGHFFLHFPLVKKNKPGSAMVATRWVNETNTEQRRAEWEANWFAAAFLMPLEQFRAAAQRHGDDTRSLAAEFGVSLHAAKIRLASIQA